MYNKFINFINDFKDNSDGAKAFSGGKMPPLPPPPEKSLYLGNMLSSSTINGSISVMLIPKYSPHEATKEKLSYLLFGFDYRSPTEAAFLPAEIHGFTDVRDYLEEVVLSLASAQELAVTNIKKAQEQYKQQYDCHATSVDYNISDLVLMRFPHEESGRNENFHNHGIRHIRRVVQCDDSDLTVTKQFFY